MKVIDLIHALQDLDNEDLDVRVLDREGKPRAIVYLTMEWTDDHEQIIVVS